MTTTDDQLAAAQRALSDLGERFNKLALENRELQERTEFYKQRTADHFHGANNAIRRALEAEKLAAANQEAADVIALMERGGISVHRFSDDGAGWGACSLSRHQASGSSVRLAVKNCAGISDITLPAKAEQACVNDTRSEPAPAAESGARYFCVKHTLPGGGNLFADIHDSANDDEARRLSYTIRFKGADSHQYADDVCNLLNGTSAIHQQLQAALKESERWEEACGLAGESRDILSAELQAAREELASLRRDRQAWDAVKEYGISIESGSGLWCAACRKTADMSHVWHAAPREAVLALAEQLEGGK